MPKDKKDINLVKGEVSNKLVKNELSDSLCCPTLFTLDETKSMMTSPDYKTRFIAEYIQTKIRYEKLKYLLTKWEAFDQRFESFGRRPSEELEEFTKWLGFKPSCSFGLLKQQQTQIEELLHTLELRAAIEGIDLRWITIKL